MTNFEKHPENGGYLFWDKMGYVCEYARGRQPMR